MDYNKPNKGFVCFVYDLGRKRAVYIVFAAIIGVLAAGLYLNFKQESPEFNYALTALCVMAVGALIAAVNPKIFIIKLCGYLLSLIGVMIGLHNINLLGRAEQNSAVFSAYFYIVLLCGLYLMVMLLSWFVYNARSSEINEI